MFFKFTLREYFASPQALARQLHRTSIKGLTPRIMATLLAGLALFIGLGWYGIHTEHLTAILVEGTTSQYTIARYVTLIGTVLAGLLFMAFHLWGMSYLLGAVTSLPWRTFLPIQLLVLIVFLVEKALVVGIFMSQGMATNVSVFSLGPIAAVTISVPFFVFFFNQLSLFTLLAGIMQYRFASVFIDQSGRKRVFFTLIGVYLIVAFFIASLGSLPIDQVVTKLFGGGLLNE